MAERYASNPVDRVAGLNTFIGCKSLTIYSRKKRHGYDFSTVHLLTDVHVLLFNTLASTMGVVPGTSHGHDDGQGAFACAIPLPCSYHGAM